MKRQKDEKTECLQDCIKLLNSECFFREFLRYTFIGSVGGSNKSRRGSTSQNSASPLDYFTFFRVQAKSMKRHFLLGDTFHELKYVPGALWWHFFPAQGGLWLSSLGPCY